MNIITLFLVSGLLLVPTLLIAQSPVAHFSASKTAICDSVYSENFTDLSSNKPTHWKWYFPGATPDTSTLQNPTNIQYKGYGCYTVKLVVQNNNGSDSLTDSNYICLDAPPNITLTGIHTCIGSQGTIEASGGTNYYWSSGSTNSYIVVSPVIVTTYSVKVYNGACYKDTMFTIGIAPPKVFLRASHTICIGDSMTIYPVFYVGNPPYDFPPSDYSFLWGNGSTEDSLVIDPDTASLYNYYVIVRDKYGYCPSDSAGITIKANDCTGVENYIDPLGEVEVYPNPNNGIFTIQFLGDVSTSLNIHNTVEVYNVLGEQVYNAMLKQVQGDNTINLFNQPNGVYLYRVISETGNLLGEGKIVTDK